MDQEEGRKNDILPHPGDLIYVPMVTSLFEITWVEDHENMVYGHRSFYKVTSKKYNPRKSDVIELPDEDITGAPSGEDPDILEDRQEIIDTVNEIMQHSNDEVDNIKIDPDETGFDPTDTVSINDDAAAEKDDVIDPNDDEDLFGKF